MTEFMQNVLNKIWFSFVRFKNGFPEFIFGGTVSNDQFI
jgi:hypothetical protein